MSNEPIRTEDAPVALGPYSQGLSVGDWVFTSGQIPLTPSGELVADSPAAAARQALDNIAAILGEAGATMADVVKVTLYLRDMEDFGAVNEVYATYFTETPPARTCIEAARLPKDAILEIDAVARIMR
jgi:2-iminobutanoate/2-iminopropanoate deaminase